MPRLSHPKYRSIFTSDCKAFSRETRMYYCFNKEHTAIVIQGTCQDLKQCHLFTKSEKSKPPSSTHRPSRTHARPAVMTRQSSLSQPWLTIEWVLRRLASPPIWCDWISPVHPRTIQTHYYFQKNSTTAANQKTWWRRSSYYFLEWTNTGGGGVGGHYRIPEMRITSLRPVSSKSSPPIVDSSKYSNTIRSRGLPRQFTTDIQVGKSLFEELCDLNKVPLHASASTEHNRKGVLHRVHLRFAHPEPINNHRSID